MEPEPIPSPSSAQLMLLANALGEIRDSWVEISLALTDLVTETDSPERDEVLVAVERHLARIREAGRHGFE